MNRAARRAEFRQLPRTLRDVPIVSVTAEQMHRYLPRHFRPGDIVTLPGMKRNPNGGGLVSCPLGEETPVRLELRA